MATTVVPITLNQLTEASLDGLGVFDVLMRANKAHLEAEFQKNRIKGAEYATVYLGSLEPVMNTALTFLLQRDKNALEAQLIEQQILLAQAEVLKAEAELAILEASLQKVPLEIAQITAQNGLIAAQTANAVAELAVIQANALKVPAEIAHLTAQTGMVQQQTENLAAEELNIPKQGLLIEAQTTNALKQIAIAEQEILVKQQQVLLATEEIKVATAKLANIPKEGVVLDKQAVDIEAKTALTTQQAANLVAEALNIPKQGAVLDGQKCKLDAEFDLLKTTNLKTSEETQLLLWKTNTEKAQTINAGVDDNSVVGKQKALYAAQTAGFQRDAEQKAADILAKTWMAQVTTDDAIKATPTNMLDDASVGRAISKLLAGVNA